MTDFEVAILFNDIATNTQSVFMNFVSLLFAYIVAAYLVAHRLSRPMTVIVTVLFTIVAVQEAATLFFTFGDQVGLFPEIQSRESLSWRGANRAGEGIVPIFNITFGTATIGGYVGAVTFFFYRRFTVSA